MESRSFLVGLAFGTVAAGAGTFIATSGLDVARRVSDKSAYVFPMRAVIDDLDTTSRNGDCELVARKLALLKTRWDDLAAQRGDPPEAFFEEIVNLRSTMPDQSESPRSP
jgi:hypothetical protein